MDLLKRLGMIVAVFSVLLVIRTLVAPPKVIVGKTADDLKAYLCQTDWWDHSFTILEVLFLIWGIRLCIVVRKAPSEFNESRFISMAIYNEFLLSLFLNISMLFLQSPANPDLLYIIFFCHTQMTVTLLLCFIFGSKAYLVFKGLGKSEDAISTAPQVHITKFINKQRTATSQYAVSTNSSTAGVDLKLTEQDVQEEFKRLYLQLEQLKEKNMRHGNRHLAARINAMQEAGRLQTTDETEETALDKTEESSFSNFNDSQGDGSQGKKIQGDCNDSIVHQSTKESLAKGSIQACEPILTDLALSKAVAKVGPNGKNNGKLPENGKGESTSAPGEATKAKVAPQVPARGMNKSMSKMPVHLNLDDTNRFTEEVTV